MLTLLLNRKPPGHWHMSYNQTFSGWRGRELESSCGGGKTLPEIMNVFKGLASCGICLNVVSAPLQVPMLPVRVHCLVALAPVAWNLRDLHQKGEMSCKIRVFWPDFAQDRGDYLMIFRFIDWQIYIYIYIYIKMYIYIYIHTYFNIYIYIYSFEVVQIVFD